MQQENAKMRVQKNSLMLKGLCIYGNLLTDPVISAYSVLIDEVSRDKTSLNHFMSCYSDFFKKLSQGSETVDFSDYIVERVLLDENPFTIAASFPGRNMENALMAAAIQDIRALKAAASISPLLIKSVIQEEFSHESEFPALIEGLPCWKTLSAGYNEVGKDRFSNDRNRISEIGNCGSELEAIPKLSASVKELKRQWSLDMPCESFVKSLVTYHTKNGYGIFTRCHAFTWRRMGNVPGCGSLAPVRHPDPVRLSDLIAYETEREEVVRNTEQFLAGFLSNNVLLYGDRGTGKSSTVKALLNEYHDRGLRMVEVPKQLLPDFAEIVELLADKPYKFILFVDDLSFENNEDGYTALKAVIEGSLETKPGNVLIYATSNRRHLVRETFSDRAGLQYGGPEDEIRAFDTIQEKLSLSDRFGITVVFSSPDKKRFLEIVDQLAQKKGLGMDPETLHKEALKWELWYNGRSPRTAQQFISYIAGRI